MKKSILFIVAFVSISSLVNAQDPSTVKKEIKTIKNEEATLQKEKKEKRKELRKLNGLEVSSLSKEHFAVDFSGVTDAKWIRSDYFDEATFIKDGKATVAFYDHEAKLVGTTQIVTYADLPAKAMDYINKKYTDYSKGTVIFFDDNEFNETDMVLYGLQFDDQDNYFVELSKNNSKLIVRVKPNGDVFYFKELN
jgi:hypothetical protein